MPKKTKHRVYLERHARAYIKADPLPEPAASHVVCTRLLRKLLQEGYSKGYIADAKTGDESGYERRVRAALDVSRKAAES